MRLGIVRRSRAALAVSTALTACVVVVALPAAGEPAPNARPGGGAVVAGAAAIVTAPSTTTINQTSARAALNWQSFDVGSQQTVRFNQPSTGAITLNRVVGPDPSQIAGRIDANGQVVLVNQAGVLFTPGAQVNAAGLVVSAAGISNQTFMAGRLVFDQAARPGARVENRGSVSIKQAGMAAFVAPQVANSGVITARLGHVVLAGASRATVDLYGDGLLALDVTGQVAQVAGANGATATALVTNTGTILADGGTVQLTARAADGIVQTLVRAGGKIRAASVGDRVGGIDVQAVGGSVVVDGELAATGVAAGTKGGTVALLASGDLTVAAGARINVSGQSGGGLAAIGTTLQRASGGPAAAASHVARTVIVQRGASILADATGSGPGGRVTLLAREATHLDGMITAKGGPAGGDGGFVELSGKRLGITGGVDVSAPHATLGRILLDPDNLDIVGSGTDTESGNFAANNGTVFASDSLFGAPDTILNTVLNNFVGNAYLQASFNITVRAPVNMTHGSLTLEGGAGVTISPGVTLSALGDVVLATGGAGPAGVAADVGSYNINVAGGVTSTTGSVLLESGSLGSIDIAAGASLVAGTGKRITLLTDFLTVEAAAGTLRAPGGAVEIAPASSGIAIALVGHVASESRLMVIPQSALSAVSASTSVLRIGEATIAGSLTNIGGNIEIGGSADLTGSAPTLALFARGSMVESVNGVLANVATLSGDAVSVGITVAGSLNSVATIGNFLATDGNFALTTGKSVKVAGVLRAGGVTISTVGAASIDVAGSILASTVTLSGQGITLETTGSIPANSITMSSSGGVSLLGNAVLGINNSFSSTGLIDISTSAGDVIEAGSAKILTQTLDSGSNITGSARLLGVNTIGTLGNIRVMTAGANSGDFQLTDTSALTVAGVLSADGNVYLRSAAAGGITFASGGTVDAGAGNTVGLQADALTFAAISGTSVSAGATGTFEFAPSTRGLTIGIPIAGSGFDAVPGIVAGTIRLGGVTLPTASVPTTTAGGVQTRGTSDLGGRTLELDAAAIGGGLGTIDASGFVPLINVGLLNGTGTAWTLTALGTTIAAIGTIHATTFHLENSTDIVVRGTLAATSSLTLNAQGSLGVAGLISSPAITLGGISIDIGSTGTISDGGVGATTLSTVAASSFGNGDISQFGGTLSGGTLTVGTLTIVTSGSVGHVDLDGNNTVATLGSVNAPGGLSIFTTSTMTVVGPVAAGGLNIEPDVLIVTGQVTSSGGGLLLDALNGVTLTSTAHVAGPRVNIFSLAGMSMLGNAVLDAGTGAMSLHAAGGIVEATTATIVAGTLDTNPLSEGGTSVQSAPVSLLGTANAIATIGDFTLQFSGSYFHLVDSTALTVSRTLTAPGGAYLQVLGGNVLTVAARGAIVAGAATVDIVADQLAITTGGTVTAANVFVAPNAIVPTATLGAGGLIASLAGIAATGFVELGAVGPVPEAAAGPPTSRAGALRFVGTFDGNGQTVVLAPGSALGTGNVDGAAGAIVNVVTLEGSGRAWTLTGAGNAVAALGTIGATTFVLTDTTDLAVPGSVVASVAATVTTQGSITVPGRVSAPAVVLGGTSIAITQTGTVSDGGAGTTSLTTAVAGSVGGSGDITVESVLVGNAVQAGTLIAGTLTLATAGTDGAATLATSKITVATLGGATLAGALVLKPTGDLTVAGPVRATAVDIQTPGQVGVSGTIASSAGLLQLDATATLTLAAGAHVAGAQVNLDADQGIVIASNAFVGGSGAVVDLFTLHSGPRHGGVVEAAGGTIMAGTLRSTNGVSDGISLAGTANAIGALGTIALSAAGSNLYVLDSVALTVAGSVSAPGTVYLHTLGGTSLGVGAGGAVTAGVVDLQADHIAIAAGGSVAAANVFLAPDAIEATLTLGSGGLIASLVGITASGVIELGVAGALPAGPPVAASTAQSGSVQIVGTFDANNQNLLFAPSTALGSGNVDGSTGALVNAATLRGSGGAWTLTAAGTSIAALGGIAVTSLAVTDSTALSVAGPVSATGLTLGSAGLLTVPGTLAATSVVLRGATIDIAGRVSGSASVSLSEISTRPIGDISVTGTLVTPSLTLASVQSPKFPTGGAANLTGRIAVASLGSVALAGTLDLLAAGSLAVAGPVTATGVTIDTPGATTLDIIGSVSAAGAGGIVSLAGAGVTLESGAGVRGGSVLIAGTNGIRLLGASVLGSAGGVVDLTTTGGGVTQVAAGRIVAGTLRSGGGVGGTVSLLGTANAIGALGNFAVAGSAALRIVDAATLAVTGTVAAGGDIVVQGNGGAGIGIAASGRLTSIADVTLQADAVTVAVGGRVGGVDVFIAPDTSGASMIVGSGGSLATLANVVASGTVVLGAVALGGPARAGSIVVAGSFDAGGQALELDATGTIGGGGALLRVATLGGSAPLWLLTNTANAIGALGRITADRFTLADALDLSLSGTLAPTTSATITDAGTLTIAGLLRAPAVTLRAAALSIPGTLSDGGHGSVSLTATAGGITEDGTLIAGKLSGGASAAALLRGSNTIVALGSFTAGSLVLQDGRALAVTGVVSGPLVTLDATALAITGTLNDAGGTTDLVARSGGITESGRVVAGVLSGSAVGAVSLGGVNAIATLGSLSAASLTLRDTGALTVAGPVRVMGAVNIASGGAVTVTGALAGAGLALRGASLALPGVLDDGGGGTDLIATSGGISATGTLRASTLTGHATGAASFGGHATVATLGDFAAASLTLTDLSGLTVAGTMTAGSVALDAKSLALPGTVRATTLSLRARGGGIAQGGTLVAGTLSGGAAGAARLTGHDSIAVLGDFSAASLVLTDLGALSVTGVVTAPTLALSATALSLVGTLTASGGASLTATAGGIAESGRLVTGRLSGSASGAIRLGGRNSIATLGDLTAGGDLRLNDAGGLRVLGAVSAGGRAAPDVRNTATLAITAGGTLALGDAGAVGRLNGGSVVLSAAGTIAEVRGVITANTLRASAAGGDIALNNAANAVAGLGSVAAARFALVDSVALTLTGTLAPSLSATITDAAALTVAGLLRAPTLALTGASLSITGTLDDQGGHITLTATAGGITESGRVASGVLSGRAVGAVSLGGVNAIATLGSLTAASLTLRDTGALTVAGPVRVTGAIDIASGGAVSVTGTLAGAGLALRGASLALPGALDDGGGGTDLVATSGDITATGKLRAGTLTGHATGTASFGGHATVATLGDFAATALTLIDLSGLTITGAVTAGSVALTAATLALPGTIDTGGSGSLRLTATAAGITGSGRIVTGVLSGSAVGAVSLGGRNQFATLGSFVAGGDLALADSVALALAGTISAGGRPAPDVRNTATLTITAGGSLTIGTASLLNGGNVVLSAAGSIVELDSTTGGIVTANTLSAQTTAPGGDILLTNAGNRITSFGKLMALNGQVQIVDDPTTLTLTGIYSGTNLFFDAGAGNAIALLGAQLTLTGPGRITLVADALTSSKSSITAPGGTLEIAPASAIAVSIGGTATAGRLTLDSVLLAAFATGTNALGTLLVGGFTSFRATAPAATASAISLDGAFDLSVRAGTLQLLTNGAITQTTATAGTGLTVGHILASGTGDILLANPANAIDAAGALTTAGGRVVLIDGHDLVLSDAESGSSLLFEVARAGGTLTLGAPGIDVPAPATLSAPGGRVSLVADRMVALRGSTVDASGGTAELAPFSAIGVSVQGSAGTPGLVLDSALLATLSGGTGTGGPIDTLVLGGFTQGSNQAKVTAASLSVDAPTDVSAFATTLLLEAHGAIGQPGGGLTVARLGALGAGVTLADAANGIATLVDVTATTGNVVLTDSAALTVAGTVTAAQQLFLAVTAPGGLTLAAGGRLVAGPASMASVQADKLTIRTGGSISGGTFEFAPATSGVTMRIGNGSGSMLISLAGVTSGAVRLGAITPPGATAANVSAGAIVLVGDFDAAGRALDLDATGTIDGGGGALLGVARLGGSATTWLLTDPANAVAALGGITAARFTLADSLDLSVTGTLAPSLSATITDAGSLTVAGLLLAPTLSLRASAVTISGTLSDGGGSGATTRLIATGGGIDATGTLIAGTLSGSATRAVSLTGSNRIASLADFAAASLTLLDGIALAVTGSVTAPTLALTATTLTLTGTLSDGGAGTTTLIATGGGIGGTGTLIAGTLSGAASDLASLTGPDTVARLGDFTASNLDLRDSSALFVTGRVVAQAGAQIISLGALTVSGTVQAPAVTLGGTALVISGTLSDGGGGGATSLTATAGGISATGPLTAGTLSGSATGTASLTGINSVGALADFTAASLTLTDVRALTVSGTVSTGALSLQATALALPGALSVSGTATLIATTGGISQTGSLTVGTLTGSAAASARLVGTNSVATLGAFAAGGDLVVSDATGLAVAGAVSAGGLQAPDAANTATLAVAVGGSLAIGGGLNGGRVALSAAGPITEAATAGSVITANTLTARTTGPGGDILLINPGNRIAASAGLTALNGRVELITDPTTLTLSGTYSGSSLFFAVAPGNAIALVGATLTASAGGRITLEADSLTATTSVITAAGGTLELAPVSAIPVSIAGLAAAGRLTLDASLLATLASGASDLGTLLVGGFTAPRGAGPSTTATSISLDGAIDLGTRAATLRLLAGGAITQTTAGAGSGLTVGQIVASGTGDIRLANAANAIGAAGVLAAAGGQVVLVDGSDLTLVGAQTGIALFDEVARVGGKLSLATTLAAPGGRISLVADQIQTLAGGTIGVAAGTLELAPVSPIVFELIGAPGFRAGTLVLGGFTDVPGGGTVATASASQVRIGAVRDFTGIAGTLDLLALGAISQPGGSLTVSRLNAHGASVALANAGNTISSVGDIAATAGDIALADAAPLTVAGMVGATGQAFVLVTADGGLTISAGGRLVAATTGLASVQADALTILAGGSISGGTFEFAPASAGGVMRIGSGAGSVLVSPAGVTSATVRLGAVTLPGATAPTVEARAIVLAGSFDAAGRPLELDATGTIDGSLAPLLNVAKLSGSAATWLLTDTNNAITALGGIAAARFALADRLDLTLIGTLAPSVSAAISDAGTLTVAGVLTAPRLSLTGAALAIPGTLSDGGGGTTSLVATTGSIDVTGTLIAGTLSGSAGGAVSLTGRIALVTLGSLTAASLVLADGGDLIVAGPVSATVNAALTAAGTVTVEGLLTAPTLAVTGAALVLAGTLSGGGTTSLTATTGGITEPAGVVVAGSLSGSAATSITLLQVNQIAAIGDLSAGGDLLVRNAGGLTVTGTLSAGGVAAPAVANGATLGLFWAAARPLLGSSATGAIGPDTLAIGGAGAGRLNGGIVSLNDYGTIQEANGAIAANTLIGAGAIDSADLTGRNTITTLGRFAAASLGLADSVGLTIAGPVLGTAGVTITTAGTLTVAGTLEAPAIALSAAAIALPGTVSDGGSGTTSLTAIPGGIAGTGTLIAGRLSGSAGGAVSLTGSNRIATLGGFSAASLVLSDGTGLAVAGPVAVITSATIAAAGSLTVDGSLAGATLALRGTAIAVPGTVGGIDTASVSLIASDGGIAVSGAVSTALLTGSATGAATLGGSRIGVLGQFTADSLQLFDASDLTVAGPVTVTGGAALGTNGILAVTGALTAGTLSLAGGALAVSGTLSDGGAGATSLTASKGSVSVSGALVAGTLSGSSVGDFILAGAERVARLGSLDVFGSLSLALPTALTVTGPVTARSVTLISAKNITVAGTLRAPVIALTAAGVAIPGAVLAGTGPVSLIATVGAIGESGTLVAGTLTGRAAGTASLTGTNRVAALGDFSAASLFFNNTSDVVLGGTISAGSLLVQAPAQRISLGDGAAIVIGATGATLDSASFVQAGQSTLAGLAGATGLLHIAVGGIAQFDAAQGLAGGGATLLLDLGSGAASGTVAVGALDVTFTSPGSATLFGSIANVTGGLAAARGTIAPATNLAYTFNGCTIGTTICRPITATFFPTEADFNAVPIPTRAGVPLVTLLQSAIPLAMIGPTDSEDLLQLPVVSQQDY